MASKIEKLSEEETTIEVERDLRLKAEDRAAKAVNALRHLQYTVIPEMLKDIGEA